MTEKHGGLHSETRISMADGTRKRLAQVENGDEVLGTDRGIRVVSTQVSEVHCAGPGASWTKLSGRRLRAGRGSSFFSLISSPEHRVWSPGPDTYTPVGEYSPSQRVTLLRSEHDLTPCQRSVLLGKLLGDGHLHKARSGSASVVWGHRQADEEYVRWTLRALGDLASTTTRTLTSGYGSTIITARSTFHPSVAECFGEMTASGKKRVTPWIADYLDPLALAFWYMDDGSLCHTEGQEDRATLSTCGFDEDDCRVLLKGLRRLGIAGTLMRDGRGYLTIRLNSAAAECLFLLVAPYVPPVMQRKLPGRYRGHNGWLPPTGERQFRPQLVPQLVEQVESNVQSKRSAWRTSSRYAITTGTHNLFANGLLVHDST
ncbi:hypothetical protein [Nocardiopsis sp. M1B1]|uniref:hypothetical protein n=1 Tax=Nocardiopsis sp. M1B1 TaxID=3450454 RepID=UPI00403A051D